MSTIFFLLFLLSFTSSVLSTKDDENVLLEIKKQFGYPDILQSWVQGFNYCDPSLYEGWDEGWGAYVYIKCTSTGRVSTINMGDINITTPFPDVVCGLTEIEKLYFSKIGLYGPIPSCITKLFNLQELVIAETSLSGFVPSFYNNTNITYINLSNNHLSGIIPPSLSTLPNLQTLVLSSNYLTGTIPPELVHGSSPTLILSNNNLTGELPKCYKWVGFMTIDLDYNRLSGDASFLFGKQEGPWPVTILLSNNEFEFDLSLVEFSDNLYAFDLSHNKIYGKVPDSLAKAARLSYDPRDLSYYQADLSSNNLCGELPQGGNMWRFKAEVFANNTCLCGSPLPPCSILAPVPAPVSEPSF